MASVVHRTTKEYRRSADTGKFPVEDWIINPDMAAVEDVPSKYWVISGDIVSEMTQAAKDSADAAETAANDAADRGEHKNHIDNRRWQSLFIWLADNTQTAKTAGEIQTDIENGIDS